jgi:type IV pilus assembly protein PilZ
MSAELANAIEQFKQLDERRSAGPLDTELEQRWEQLKEAIERAGPLSERAPPSSRRRALRVATHLDVSFGDADGFAKAYLRNISEGGVYIETERPLAMGNRFELTIHVGKPLRTVDLPVQVVWVNAAPSGGSGLSKGIGVAFLDLAGDKKKLIKSIVYEALDRLS